jgi:hypothetical protein
MMGTYPQQELRFADENVFNEQLVSFDYLIPVLAVTPSFVSGRMTDRSLQTRMFHTRPGYRMPRAGGQITIETLACGAQADTKSGALAHTWDTKLDADGLGGSDLTQVGGVAGAGATAAAMANRTGTGLRGGIIRVGQAGDGRAEGQAAVATSPVTDLLTALPAAPSATDEIRASIMLWPRAVMGASKRFCLSFADDADMAFIFSGCHLASWGFRIVHGDVPIKVRTYNYAYWRQVSAPSLPASADLAQCDAAVSGGGSYCLQARGTSTRPANAEAQSAEVELTLNLGLAPKFGEVPGVPLCHITDWVRTKPDGPAGRLRMVHPYDEALFSSYDKDGSDSDYFHWLATLSAGEGTDATEGRHVQLYAPSMYRIEERMPPTPWSDLQYQTSVFGLQEGPDTTTELSRSFFRIGIS